MSDINKTILVGRLTKEPVLRTTQNGNPVCAFSIAVNRTYNKQEEASYFNCVAWGKTGELIHQYTKKGQRIGIDGRLRQRQWDKDGVTQYTVEVIVETFQFLDSKSDKDNDKKKGDFDDNYQPSFDSLPDTNPFSDDDVPF